MVVAFSFGRGVCKGGHEGEDGEVKRMNVAEMERKKLVFLKEVYKRGNGAFLDGVYKIGDGLWVLIEI